MIKILMHGCNGKMGRMITEIAKQDQDVEIVAGVDKYTAVANEYPVFETISECDVDADAVIDFSNAGAVDELLDYCVEKKLPLYNRTVRRAACKGERSIRKDRSVKVSEYVHGNQSSPEAFKRCSKSTCTGRIRYGAC